MRSSQTEVRGCVALAHRLKNDQQGQQDTVVLPCRDCSAGRYLRTQKSALHPSADDAECATCASGKYRPYLAQFHVHYPAARDDRKNTPWIREGGRVAVLADAAAAATDVPSAPNAVWMTPMYNAGGKGGQKKGTATVAVWGDGWVGVVQIDRAGDTPSADKLAAVGGCQGGWAQKKRHRTRMRSSI